MLLQVKNTCRLWRYMRARELRRLLAFVSASFCCLAWFDLLAQRASLQVTRASLLVTRSY